MAKIKEKIQLPPIAVIFINGGAYQGHYSEAGVGRPEIDIVDWDNIRGGDKPGLTERELKMIGRTDPDVEKELRQAMKDCDPGCDLNIGNDALDECNCSRIGKEYKPAPAD